MKLTENQLDTIRSEASKEAITAICRDKKLQAKEVFFLLDIEGGNVALQYNFILQHIVASAKVIMLTGTENKRIDYSLLAKDLKC